MSPETDDRNADLDPQLIWRGKTTAALEVPAPPLFIQEKVHPKALIDDLLRQSKARAKESAVSSGEDTPDLFADFNGLPKDAKSTDFYKHDGHWQNRMILGDSLQVMASLAEREGLRGKVQCIYFDPPYGIKFNSNFQWSTTSRDVKDGNKDHITREPEQVKAFRDTWRDGIHSYLTYLRDRLTTARDLLTDSGSLFIQISDENIHKLRAILDEIFGEENFICQISYVTTTATSASLLPTNGDFILWFAKNRSQVKYRQPFTEKSNQLASYNICENRETGEWRKMTKSEFEDWSSIPKGWSVVSAQNLRSQGVRANTTCAFEYQGRSYHSGGNHNWKTTMEGVKKLIQANRLILSGSLPNYKRFVDDFPVIPLSNYWDDTAIAGFSGEDKLYIVQTASKVAARCLLMATDPGDLVLDPTCGSGTTATVAEQWGRRWITIDTSRVALALARARIMGARYPYYLLADSREGQLKEAEITRTAPRTEPVHGHMAHGFVYERVPHITLKSIANNAEIDVIWEDHQTRLEPLRQQLNEALGTNWQEWEIPRELKESHFPSSISVHSRSFAVETLQNWWEQRIARQKEIDASISAKAESEFLYDKPYQDTKKVRVAGPFTMESVSPHRFLSVDENDEVVDGWKLSSGSSPYDKQQDFATLMLENLKTAGVQQAHKENRLTFSSVTAFPGTKMICGEGRYTEGESPDAPVKRAGIYIGPEFGTVSRPDLVEAAREAGDLGFDVLIACAFNYDAHSSEFEKLGRIPVLKARMNADLHMAGDLKNTGKGNLFVIFGEPDVEVTCGLWLVARGGRMLAPYEHITQLSGLGSLEEINRLGGKDLPGFKRFPTGRALRTDQSDPESGGLGAIEHRGGSGPLHNGGISERAQRGDRVTGGIGDAVDRREPSGHASSADDEGTAGGIGGNQQNAGRPASLARKKTQLNAASKALSTLTAQDFPLSLTTSHLAQITIHGVDVFKPQTGEVVSSGPEGIACWFVDTDYNEESFFVRHAYFLGQNDPYKSLKTTLKAEIDAEAWESLNRDTSRPFPKPTSGRIAVKVINHLGDEVMKVFSV
jgi:adenine-specific DNA-methyltransferase